MRTRALISAFHGSVWFVPFTTFILALVLVTSRLCITPLSANAQTNGGQWICYSEPPNDELRCYELDALPGLVGDVIGIRDAEVGARELKEMLDTWGKQSGGYVMCSERHLIAAEFSLPGSHNQGHGHNSSGSRDETEIEIGELSPNLSSKLRDACSSTLGSFLADVASQDDDSSRGGYDGLVSATKARVAEDLASCSGEAVWSSVAYGAEDYFTDVITTVVTTAATAAVAGSEVSVFLNTTGMLATAAEAGGASLGLAAISTIAAFATMVNEKAGMVAAQNAILWGETPDLSQPGAERGASRALQALQVNCDNNVQGACERLNAALRRIEKQCNSTGGGDNRACNVVAEHNRWNEVRNKEEEQPPPCPKDDPNCTPPPPECPKDDPNCTPPPPECPKDDPNCTPPPPQDAQSSNAHETAGDSTQGMSGCRLDADCTTCEEMKAAWSLFEFECGQSNWQAYKCKSMIYRLNSCVDPGEVFPAPDGKMLCHRPDKESADAFARAQACEKQGSIAVLVPTGNQPFRCTAPPKVDLTKIRGYRQERLCQRATGGDYDWCKNRRFSEAGRRYKAVIVELGDSLSRIAEKAGLGRDEWKQIRDLNRRSLGDRTNKIFVGERIVVPRTEGP